MKRKSLFLPGAALIKWHAVIYIVFTIALWLSVASIMNYGNGGRVVPTGLVLDRIGVTILWGLVFLAHFAFHQVTSWTQSRARQSHLKVVDQMQERYVSSARLDLEAEAEDGILIDEDDWIAQRRLQSK